MLAPLSPACGRVRRGDRRAGASGPPGEDSSDSAPLSGMKHPQRPVAASALFSFLARMWDLVREPLYEPDLPRQHLGYAGGDLHVCDPAQGGRGSRDTHERSSPSKKAADVPGPQASAPQEGAAPRRGRQRLRGLYVWFVEVTPHPGLSCQEVEEGKPGEYRRREAEGRAQAEEGRRPAARAAGCLPGWVPIRLLGLGLHRPRRVASTEGGRRGELVWCRGEGFPEASLDHHACAGRWKLGDSSWVPTEGCSRTQTQLVSPRPR